MQSYRDTKKLKPVVDDAAAIIGLLRSAQEEWPKSFDVVNENQKSNLTAASLYCAREFG